MLIRYSDLLKNSYVKNKKQRIRLTFFKKLTFLFKSLVFLRTSIYINKNLYDYYCYLTFFRKFFLYNYLSRFKETILVFFKNYYFLFLIENKYWLFNFLLKSTYFSFDFKYNYLKYDFFYFFKYSNDNNFNNSLFNFFFFTNTIYLYFNIFWLKDFFFFYSFFFYIIYFYTFKKSTRFLNNYYLYFYKNICTYLLVSSSYYLNEIIIFIKTLKKKITLLRSPHKDKISREQFELLKNSICIFLPYYYITLLEDSFFAKIFFLNNLTSGIELTNLKYILL